MVGRFKVVLAVAATLLAGAASAAPKGAMDSVVQTAVAAAVTRDADPEELIRTAGSPDADYVYRALKGEIDLFVQKQDNGAVAAQLKRGEETKRRVVDLRVLEWHGKECSCSAILLFREDDFIYALVPVSGSEDSVDDLKNRHAEPPRQLEIAGPGVRARMFAYPDRGVGYVATGPGPFAFKVVFPDGTTSKDFRGAIAPAPARKGRGSNVRGPAVGSPPRPTPPPKRSPPPRRR